MYFVRFHGFENVFVNVETIIFRITIMYAS